MARFLATVFLPLICLAPGVEALAHGWAHHVEHAGLSAAWSHQSTNDRAPAISEADGDDDHPHPVIDGVVRWGADRAAIVSRHQPVIAVSEARSSRAGSPWPARSARTPGDLSAGPPPRLRAPPIA